MAKSQKRSNREVKKPKAVKPKPAAVTAAPSILQDARSGKKLTKAAK